jgi:hypothetical protein
MCAHEGPFNLGHLVCDRVDDHDEEALAGHTYGTGSPTLDAEAS